MAVRAETLKPRRCSNTLAIREKSFGCDHPDLARSAVSKERSKRDLAAGRHGKAGFATISTEHLPLQILSAEFSDYAALSNPLPMTVKEIQSLLSSDEAMVLLSVTVKDSNVIAITREGFDWNPIGRRS
jgi:hypothetical protein